MKRYLYSLSLALLVCPAMQAMDEFMKGLNSVLGNDLVKQGVPKLIGALTDRDDVSAEVYKKVLAGTTPVISAIHFDSKYAKKEYKEELLALFRKAPSIIDGSSQPRLNMADLERLIITKAAGPKIKALRKDRSRYRKQRNKGRETIKKLKKKNGLLVKEVALLKKELQQLANSETDVQGDSENVSGADGASTDGSL